MSVIATINVHKCDGCDRVEVNQSEADCEGFAEVWFAGLEVDFCDRCKDKIEHQAVIDADENSMASLHAKMRNIRTRHSSLVTRHSPTKEAA